jgi:nicotinamide mononucleotide transporter
LATRGIIWCWPAGIIGSAIYIYINMHHHLFQDAILQFYYIIAGFYGWYLWHRKQLKEEPDIISWSVADNLKLIVLGTVLIPVFGYIFAKLGNSLSYYDSFVTVFSFIATWMTAKKIIENWLYWVVIDLVAGTMYYIKDLHATTGLYIFYSVIAIYGYYEWRKQFIKT